MPLELIRLCERIEALCPDDPDDDTEHAAQDLAAAVRAHYRAESRRPRSGDATAQPMAHGTIVTGVVVHCPQCGHANTITVPHMVAK